MPPEGVGEAFPTYQTPRRHCRCRHWVVTVNLCPTQNYHCLPLLHRRTVQKLVLADKQEVALTTWTAQQLRPPLFCLWEKFLLVKEVALVVVVLVVN